MGLSELCVVDSDSPLLFQDAQRKFVIMPLPKTSCIAPSEDAIRIHSTSNGRHIPDPPATERSRPTKPKAARHDAESGNGQDDLVFTQETKRGQEAGVANGQSANLVQEAHALKDLLRDAYLRVNGLIAAIKRQKKQSRLVASTLASLKQLQKIDS